MRGYVVTDKNARLRWIGKTATEKLCDDIKNHVPADFHGNFYYGPWSRRAPTGEPNFRVVVDQERVEFIAGSHRLDVDDPILFDVPTKRQELKFEAIRLRNYVDRVVARHDEAIPWGWRGWINRLLTPILLEPLFKREVVTMMAFKSERANDFIIFYRETWVDIPRKT